MNLDYIWSPARLRSSLREYRRAGVAPEKALRIAIRRGGWEYPDAAPVVAEIFKISPEELRDLY
jgi:hypothetical protein